MLKKYSIIGFCLITFFAFSQEQGVSQLKKIFFHAKNIETAFPDSSIHLYEGIIEKAKANPDQEVVGQSYHRLAELVNEQTKDLNKYFDLSYKAIKIFEATHDSAAAIQIYQNLGVAFVRQGRFDEALTYYRLVDDYSTRHKLSNLFIASKMAIAECYSSTGKSDTAIIILRSLLANFPKDGKNEDYGMLLNNLGNTYYNFAEQKNDKADFLNSIEYAKKAIEVFKKPPIDPENVAYSYGLLGASFMAIGNYNESELNYDSAIRIYNTQHRFSDLEFIYNELTKLYMLQGKTEKALQTFAKYDSLSKSIFSEENSNSISAMRTQFETDKKENENKLLQKENSQQRIISYFIIGLLLLAVSSAFFIFRGLKNQRRANQIISKQKEEVHAQKALIEEHQKETIDSINYAKRIQFALLAQYSLLRENLSEHFVLFKPKDIVSGDFYWAASVKTSAAEGNKNLFYLAVCDSTGHGVPGAFMSLLNMGFLSEAIKEKNISAPNEILNYVRKRLIDSIGNDGQKDGMDAILICIDNNANTGSKKKITYAAANNEPVLVKNDTVIELPKDRMPVGKGEKDDSFTLHDLEVEKGDVLYLYTDGYADQFGGPKGKKFKYKALNDLLLATSTMNVKDQSEILQRKLEEWKGSLEQVDDVCIVGIKL